MQLAKPRQPRPRDESRRSRGRGGWGYCCLLLRLPGSCICVWARLDLDDRIGVFSARLAVEGRLKAKHRERELERSERGNGCASTAHAGSTTALYLGSARGGSGLGQPRTDSNAASQRSSGCCCPTCSCGPASGAATVNMMDREGKGLRSCRAEESEMGGSHAQPAMAG